MGLIVVSTVALLILVNALYVAAEFGAVGARRSRIHELAGSGHRLAGLLLPVLRDSAALDRYVATCQIGITLSSLVLGAYGQATLAVALTPVLADLGRLQPVIAESTAAVTVLVGLTVLQVVFGELVPKSVALRHPTAVSLYTVLPMRWSIWVFRWFIAVLNGSGVFLLRRLGMTGDGHRHVHSPEELDLLIAESRDGGLLEADEQRRLHEALRLGVRTARQLMVPRTAMVAVDADCSGERLLDLALKTPFSRLPVYEGSTVRVIGVLHTRDLVLGYVQHRPTGSVRELARSPHMVPETMTADQVLRFLREQRTHLALVIDEYGDVAGLVTIEDVLSELLGEIGDEFRLSPVQAERLPDGRLRMPGRLPLFEAQRLLGTDWESEADTIAGHLMHVLGRLPAQGEQVTLDGLQIEVERLRGRVPGTLLITPRPGPGEAPGG